MVACAGSGPPPLKKCPRAATHHFTSNKKIDEVSEANRLFMCVIDKCAHRRRKKMAGLDIFQISIWQEISKDTLLLLRSVITTCIVMANRQHEKNTFFFLMLRTSRQKKKSNWRWANEVVEN